MPDNDGMMASLEFATYDPAVYNQYFIGQDVEVTVNPVPMPASTNRKVN